VDREILADRGTDQRGTRLPEALAEGGEIGKLGVGDIH
jgi:hypothetical protein